MKKLRKLKIDVNNFLLIREKNIKNVYKVFISTNNKNI